MAAIRSKGGLVLNKYLLARVFDYDDHADEARTACIAKGWGDVRRGPPWMIETGPGYTTCVTISADNSMLAVCNNFDIYGYESKYGANDVQLPLYDKHETVIYDVSGIAYHGTSERQQMTQTLKEASSISTASALTPGISQHSLATLRLW